MNKGLLRGQHANPDALTTQSMAAQSRLFPVQMPSTGKRVAARIPGYNSAQGLNNTQAAGRCYAVPLMVSAACSLSSISAGWHTVGTTGAVLRMGLYTDSGSFWPSNLIVDAGTLDTTATSPQTITLATPVQIPAYTTIWAVMAFQGAPTTWPNVKASGNATTAITALWGAGPAVASTVDTVLNCSDQWFYVTGVTGALPAIFPAVTTATLNPNAPVIVCGVL